jgi:hypothetical protein
MPRALYKGEPPARRPAASCPSGDDTAVDAGFVGVGGDCFLSFEVPIALDGEAAFAADRGKLNERYVTKLRAT